MNSFFYFLRSFVFIGAGLLTIGFFTGCSTKKIPSTSIKDTRENRRVVAFLQVYRAAVEKRSVDAVMELVAKDYGDNMGTEKPEDYINFLGLKEKLQKYFPRILDLRLGMYVQNVSPIEKDKYQVVFYFSKQVLTEVPSGEKWFSFKEVNKMIIRKRQDKNSPYEFEILSGI
jgi:hypothetical protein